MFLTFPEDLRMPNNLTCEALFGLSLEFQCTYNATNRTLKLANAFPFATEPSRIQFSVSPIINPPLVIVTKSFSVATYTSDYYLLDSQSQGLVLNMSCLLPCKSCVKEDASRCESCFSPLTQDFEVTEKPYLAKEMCYEACPSGTYEHLG